MRAAVLFAILFSMAVVSLSGCGGAITNLFGSGGTPAITSVTPNPVTRGQTLTVNGLFLNGTFTTVFFLLNNVTAGQVAATSGNTTSAQLTCPTGIAAGTYEVYVVTNDGQGDYSSNSNTLSLTVQ